MKKRLLSTMAFLLFVATINAQDITDKIILTKGQKITMSSDMKSNIKQGAMGTMVSNLNTTSEMEVVDVTDTGYILEVIMKKAKMDFEGFGMKQEYDSEDENKQGGMMAKGFEKALKKSNKVTLKFNGEASLLEKPKERKGMGGMFKMMGGGNAATTASDAFLLLPKDVEVGTKWRVTNEDDGLKVITEYTYEGMMGIMANVTANEQTTGTQSGAGRGGSYSTTVNQLTQKTIMVDASTGLISMKTISTKDSSTSQMGENSSVSDGTIETTIIYE